MDKLCVIGEALIDFIPSETGKKLKNVSGFLKMPGGSVANVAAAYSACGHNSMILTQLGNDAFGDFLIDCMNRAHIDTSYILQSDEFDTSLAFVSLDENGDRDFKFYRKTAADLQYDPSNITENILDDCKMIHFCSVDLVDSKMKKAHLKLIDLAKNNHITISFDPNLRFSLWPDEKSLFDTVHEFIPYADILKISEEEVEFLSQGNHNEFICSCLDTCKILLVTKGADGAVLYTKNHKIEINGVEVDVKDTMGAGDAFIGSFLAKLADLNTSIELLTYDELYELLVFANKYAAYSTTKLGALSSMPSIDELR